VEKVPHTGYAVFMLGGFQSMAGWSPLLCMWSRVKPLCYLVLF